MSSIGKATLNVVPSFSGLSQSVQNAFRSVNVSSIGVNAGANYSSGMASGIAKSGAIAGAVAAVTQKALSALSSSLSSAISRFDTLNSYPRVMESLGYETSTVNDSLNLMDERLQGLPTSLSDMVSTVQGLSVCTGDLDQATQAGLALNDMLLSSGSSTQITTAAMEQFRQMLSKGKPDMQDWKSLMQAMPGQMTQLAHEMLGAEASATDLYSALGGGGAEATISMNDLLEAMIQLDTEGGESCSSFAEQAKSATGGVSTSMANLQTAVTRGLANTMEAIGQSNISGAFSDLKGFIDDAFKGLNSAVEAAMPTVKELYNFIKSNGSTIATAAAAFVSLSVAITAAFKIKNLVMAINPASAAIVGLTAAISVATAIYSKWQTNTENAEKATTGLDTAIKRATSLSSFSGTLDSVAESAKDSASTIEEANARTAEFVDSVNEITQKAEEETATLNTAQKYINEYAGQTDLSTEAQGKLQWAIDEVNEQFGTTLSMEDALNGFYSDQNDNVVDLKDSVNDLIDAKKREIEINALEEQYTLATKKSSAAASNYAKVRMAWNEAYNNSYDSYSNSLGSGASEEQRQRDATNVANQKIQDEYGYSLDEARQRMNDAADTAEQFAEKIGFVQTAAEAADGTLLKWADSLSDSTKAILDANGGVDSFVEDLEALGVSTTDLANLTPEKLETVALSYDGTAASIIKALSDAGVSIDTINAMELEDKSATAELDTSSAESSIDRLKNKLANLWSSTTDAEMKLYYAEAYAEAGNAAGGIRLNASGGIRAHANGAIATRAVPLDIVGEDGAEAIVPLTNKRYSLPFAKTIAEQMDGAGDVTNTYIINGLNYLPDSNIARAVDNVFAQVMRAQRMGV